MTSHSLSLEQPGILKSDAYLYTKAYVAWLICSRRVLGIYKDAYDMEK